MDNTEAEIINPKPRLRRILSIAWKVALFCFLFPVVQVIVLKWIDPPMTAMMFWNGAGNLFSGESISCSHSNKNFSDVAPSFYKAVVAGEDQRFFEHNGFDWKEAISPITNSLRDITFTNNKWVAIGDRGTTNQRRGRTHIFRDQLRKNRAVEWKLSCQPEFATHTARFLSSAARRSISPSAFLAMVCDRQRGQRGGGDQTGGFKHLDSGFDKSGCN